ncbi:hypothetical protein MHM84_03485 [Halomonas sp. McH1-25]|uniref:hypothetical protein n=1 Tax=unclassified Halomonas TaxID=2609666 RepID=UPI001EF3ED39|nr:MULTISPECIES: hypothetical protein [unclassified Halomonas]MCG7598834.1 hypothetical protein [Halomonas sp. McH1-25]MCP1340797.1 hypothetical protein [Halomonas sp. FL8]MCP1362220.1 hypothetical protein [Halomonas sp. BBD45]MCP1364116.1 hypothetical protein [Halomonas sp. BBD48]
MSEQKWTPAPWQAATDMPGAWVIWRGVPAEAVLAELYSDDMGYEHNAEANAHLMAAAPDMAAAIQLFIDSLEGRDVHPEEAIGALRASLAKARGEQP